MDKTKYRVTRQRPGNRVYSFDFEYYNSKSCQWRGARNMDRKLEIKKLSLNLAVGESHLLELESLPPVHIPGKE